MVGQAGREGGEGGLQCLSLARILRGRVSRLLQHRAAVSPHLPSGTWVLTEALLVALHVPGQAEFQLGFGFPSLIPGCSGNGSLLLPGSLSLLQPLPPSFVCLPFARSSSSPRQPPGFLA